MSGNSDLNFNRYFRLMALAVVNLLFLLPLGIYTMVVNTTESSIYIWRGLSDLHFDFSAVDQYPAIVWRANPLARASIMFSEWSFIGCALLFFAFFGFGNEALRHYRKVYEAATKRLGVRHDAWQRLPETLKWRTRHAATFYSTNAIHIDYLSFGPPYSRSKPTGQAPINVDLPTIAPKPKRDTVYTTSSKVSISISLSDVGPDGNVVDKPPGLPLDRAPSSRFSIDSDPFISISQLAKDEKKDKRSHSPSLPIEDPGFVLDVHRMTVQRPAPDVPSSVRHSMDMV